MKIVPGVDDGARDCLTLVAERQRQSIDVLEWWGEPVVERGVPVFLRSHNGPELMAHWVRNWRGRTGVTTLFIEAGSPWENAHVESFNGQLRGGCLNRQIFCIRWRGQKR